MRQYLASHRHIILGCNILLLFHLLFSLLLTFNNGRKGLDRERKKRRLCMVLGAEERPEGMGKRRNSCGAGRKMETGNETDTLPLWEGGLSQCEQNRAKMKRRKPEKRRKMEQGRSQTTTGSSTKRSKMKAGHVGEKQTVKKTSRILCKRQRIRKKSYENASNPAAETHVHLHQHHTTDQHQGRRFGVDFQLHGKVFSDAEHELQLPLKSEWFRGAHSYKNTRPSSIKPMRPEATLLL